MNEHNNYINKKNLQNKLVMNENCASSQTKQTRVLGDKQTCQSIVHTCLVQRWEQLFKYISLLTFSYITSN